jgi:hypothetical protein
MNFVILIYFMNFVFIYEFKLKGCIFNILSFLNEKGLPIKKNRWEMIKYWKYSFLIQIHK